MMSYYQERLLALRKAFPPPVSDPVQDGYVASSILRALDQVDLLKSERPILGWPVEPDYSQTVNSEVPDEGLTVEAVTPELVRCLEGVAISSHPQSQMNVSPSPSIPGLSSTTNSVPVTATLPSAGPTSRSKTSTPSAGRTNSSAICRNRRARRQGGAPVPTIPPAPPARWRARRPRARRNRS